MSLMATAVNRLAALIAHAEADAARLRAAAQSPAVQPAQYPNAIRDDMVIGGAINTQPYPAAQLVQPAQSESVTDAPESPQPAP